MQVRQMARGATLPGNFFMPSLVESTTSTPARPNAATAIKFEAYRDGARLMNFAPVAAMAVGPESVPISGDVSFRDGLLVLDRGDDHAAGVSLLWDIGALGSFQQETTRLPPREKPYNLNVELARFRQRRSAPCGWLRHDLGCAPHIIGTVMPS